jgi:hypothetical protein
MPNKRRKRQNELPVLHPDAAGVDIGPRRSLSPFLQIVILCPFAGFPHSRATYLKQSLG